MDAAGARRPQQHENPVHDQQTAQHPALRQFRLGVMPSEVINRVSNDQTEQTGDEPVSPIADR